MNIAVTEKHIRAGERWSASACPIALACAKKVSVAVGTESITFFRKSGQPIEVGLPPMARKFIEKFDTTGKARPITFKVGYEA